MKENIHTSITHTPIISDITIIDHDNESIREVQIANPMFHLNIENREDRTLILDIEIGGPDNNRVEIEPHCSTDIMTINLTEIKECLINIYYMHYNEDEVWLDIDPEFITDPILLLEYNRTGSMTQVISEGTFIQDKFAKTRYIRNDDLPLTEQIVEQNILEDNIYTFHHETLVIKSK